MIYLLYYYTAILTRRVNDAIAMLMMVMNRRLRFIFFSANKFCRSFLTKFGIYALISVMECVLLLHTLGIE